MIIPQGKRSFVANGHYINADAISYTQMDINWMMVRKAWSKERHGQRKGMVKGKAVAF